MYICRGDENGEEWSPFFVYHGFRYVEVTGYYGRNAPLELIEGMAVNTDLHRIGYFQSSHADLNNLYQIMLRTLTSNYHGFPEDCPVREKCGWLGDAQITSQMTLYTLDVTSSYEKYLSDIRTTYETYGDWMMVAPGKRTCGHATALWGCAQIIIPYYLFLFSGDITVIKDNYQLMEAYIERECKRAEGYIIKDGLGDWCPPVKNDGERRMPISHSSTLMFYEICMKMTDICRFLKRDAKKYLVLAQNIRLAFNEAFYDRKNHSYGYWGTNAQAFM